MIELFTSIEKFLLISRKKHGKFRAKGLSLYQDVIREQFTLMDRNRTNLQVGDIPRIGRIARGIFPVFDGFGRDYRDLSSDSIRLTALQRPL